MKNNRKKSKPKFPTCGKACITVSRRALIPLAIFSVFFLKVHLSIIVAFSEMLETPYYIHYSPSRMIVHKMVTSKYFDLAISAVIGLNVITMAMEFYMMPRVIYLFWFGAEFW